MCQQSGKRPAAAPAALAAAGSKKQKGAAGIPVAAAPVASGAAAKPKAKATAGGEGGALSSCPALRVALYLCGSAASAPVVG